MIIKDRLIEELVNLQGEIYSYLQKGDMSSKQLEILLRNIEKRRYNILNEIKLYNKIKDEDNKIDSLDNRYIATYNDGILKLYIPETMPKFKTNK